jgi:hypothetical protein
MRQHVALQGKTTAEKLAHVERILDSFRGRLGKTVLGIIPPVPIIAHCDAPVDGLIASLLIPISGIIDQAYIRIGDYEAKGAKITASVISGTHTTSTEFMCTRQSHSFVAGWSIEAGDLVEVKGEGVIDIHIAFALQPNMSRAVKEKHMIEGFLALIEGDDNGVSE